MDADGELVDRALAGDLSAFECLVERHRDVVFRVAARIVGREEAEDVSQDAFLRAFHRLSAFRGDAPFRVWLLRITRNAALNHQARRRAEPVESVEPLVGSPPGGEKRATRRSRPSPRPRLAASRGASTARARNS